MHSIQEDGAIVPFLHMADNAITEHAIEKLWFQVVPLLSSRLTIRAFTAIPGKVGEG